MYIPDCVRCDESAGRCTGMQCRLRATKGADAKMVQAMDVAMNRYADIVEDWCRDTQNAMVNRQIDKFEQEKIKNDKQNHVKNARHPVPVRLEV